MKLRSPEASELIRHSATARKLFCDVFGRKPEHTAAAPGRVNVIGEHTDYNDGIVLPFAIDRHTFVAGSRSENSGQCRIYSGHFNKLIELDLGSLTRRKTDQWSNYVIGIVAGFQAKGISIPGFEAAIHSNIPMGSGLSSSAALEVAMATFLEAIANVQLEPTETALLCQRAEHDFAGVPCGIMDQFASVFGVEDHLIKIDCKTMEVEAVPIQTDGVSFLVVDSGSKHELTNGEYALRKQQCSSALLKLQAGSYRDVSIDMLETLPLSLTESEFRRARHVVTEIDRTQKAVGAVRSGRWNEIGSLLYSSHYSLRDDFEVTCTELDFLVDLFGAIGVAGGVIGARMTGGGFGGCAISIIESGELDAVTRQIKSKFEARFGHKLNACVMKPSAGAQIL